MRRSPLIPRPRRRVGLIVLLLALVVALVGPLLPVRPAAVGAETVQEAPVWVGRAVEVADEAPSSPWVWPTGTREVVRPWEAPASDYAAGHGGIDLAAPLGTPAVAVADGTVSFAGQVAGRGVVTIDHGDGLLSTLDSVEPSVRTGDTVEQGAAVGVVTVGHCPAVAACVHLGARVDGRYVDPLPFLPPAAWPVLLPESAWPG
ncbi:peptidase M23 [Curtobacterium sp. SGAir0471]|uniref:M23 family metallopeptidase n=1 Tax=Curtobacterium sp. SGAir0471 TaxID=2070337 RepID=UPI0010CCEBFB|nr:M23 family metallopeptidase [Curtobacterium sp. SGAir0471]QCR43781.1 peptidase M23 [Curtobacterium sp. SGAir0471]